jgi:hypothetical protein
MFQATPVRAKAYLEERGVITRAKPPGNSQRPLCDHII